MKKKKKEKPCTIIVSNKKHFFFWHPNKKYFITKKSRSRAVEEWGKLTYTRININYIKLNYMWHANLKSIA